MSKITEQFIRKIPKNDLHLHLDGSLRLPTQSCTEHRNVPTHTKVSLHQRKVADVHNPILVEIGTLIELRGVPSLQDGKVGDVHAVVIVGIAFQESAEILGLGGLLLRKRRK